MGPRLQRGVFDAVWLSLLIGFAMPAAAQSFQEGVNRPGTPYLVLSVPGAQRCQSACIGDGRCQAWVYVGTAQTENCQLLSQRPKAVHDLCCYSGTVK